MFETDDKNREILPAWKASLPVRAKMQYLSEAKPYQYQQLSFLVG